MPKMALMFPSHAAIVDHIYNCPECVELMNERVMSNIQEYEKTDPPMTEEEQKKFDDITEWMRQGKRHNVGEKE